MIDIFGVPFLKSFRMCIDAEATTPATSCSDNKFLEHSVGQCIPCDGACAGCYGPSALDCACCRFGDRDSRGACPISLDGSQEGQTACTFRTTQVGCSVGCRKLFVALDERLVSKTKRKKKNNEAQSDRPWYNFGPDDTSVFVSPSEWPTRGSSWNPDFIIILFSPFLVVV